VQQKALQAEGEEDNQFRQKTFPSFLIFKNENL